MPFTSTWIPINPIADPQCRCPECHSHKVDFRTWETIRGDKDDVMFRCNNCFLLSWHDWLTKDTNP